MSTVIVQDTKCPMYAVRMLGPRHFIIAGGGGAAKCGIPNTIQIYSLDVSAFDGVVGTLVTTIDTGISATMNMDVLPLPVLTPVPSNPKENTTHGKSPHQLPHADHYSKFLIATGQDHFCKFYQVSYSVMVDQENKKKRLGFVVDELAQLETVTGKDSYQKGTRFSPNGMFCATAGTDGQYRLWDCSNAAKFGHKLKEHQVFTSDVDAVDISPSCSKLLAVGRGGATIWNIESGLKFCDLPQQPENAPMFKGAPVKYRYRTAAFSNLGKRNEVFFTVAVRTDLKAQTPSFVTQWVVHLQEQNVRPLVTRPICIPIVYAMAVNAEGTLLAFGSADGSVLVFDSAELVPLNTFRGAHNTFVTALEFVPSHPPLGTALSCFMRDSLCAVLSVSADNSVQLHSVAASKVKFGGFFPFKNMSFSACLCFMSTAALLTYKFADFVDL